MRIAKPGRQRHFQTNRRLDISHQRAGGIRSLRDLRSERGEPLFDQPWQRDRSGERDNDQDERCRRGALKRRHAILVHDNCQRPAGSITCGNRNRRLASPDT